jgi:hypothetical protein
VDLLVRYLTIDQPDISEQQELKRLLVSGAAQNFDLEQLTNGHDLNAMLGLALQGRLGDRKPDQTFSAEVKIHLRLAFSDEDFVRTPLFLAILRWEDVNVPYVILKRPLTVTKPRVLH